MSFNFYIESNMVYGIFISRNNMDFFRFRPMDNFSVFHSIHEYLLEIIHKVATIAHNHSVTIMRNHSVFSRIWYAKSWVQGTVEVQISCRFLYVLRSLGMLKISYNNQRTKHWVLNINSIFQKKKLNSWTHLVLFFCKAYNLSWAVLEHHKYHLTFSGVAKLIINSIQ